jgi:hypothetical protein
MAQSAIMITRHLKQSILAVVSIKVVLILLAAIFLYGPRQRPGIDSDVLDRRILSHAIPNQWRPNR